MERKRYIIVQVPGSIPGHPQNILSTLHGRQKRYLYVAFGTIYPPLHKAALWAVMKHGTGLFLYCVSWYAHAPIVIQTTSLTVSGAAKIIIHNSMAKLYPYGSSVPCNVLNDQSGCTVSVWNPYRYAMPFKSGCKPE